jgi:hypothetical protein
LQNYQDVFEKLIFVFSDFVTEIAMREGSFLRCNSLAVASQQAMSPTWETRFFIGESGVKNAFLK